MQKLLPLFMLIFSTVVQAAPVTWTLNGVTFEDGGTLEGSFVYDADTAEFSNILIEAYGGGTTSPDYDITRLYTDGSGGSNPDGAALYMYWDFLGCFSTGGAPCSYTMDLKFASALTDAGGNIAVSPGYQRVPDLAEIGSREYVYGYYGPSTAPSRYVVSGSVSAVPVPAAVWLFGSALAGLGWMRRTTIA